VSETVEAPEFDLRGQLQGLWRRRLLIALVTFLVVGSSVLATWRQDPSYQGEVRVLLERRSTESLFAETEEPREPARTVKDEMEVIKSEPVDQAVREKLGNGTKVAVSQVADTDMVIIKARSGVRTRAAEYARAYAEAYVEFRRSQALADLEVATRSVEKRVNDLQAQIDGLDKQITDAVNTQVDAAVRQARGTVVDAGQFLRSEPVAGMSARRTQLLGQQDTLKQRLDELHLTSELRTAGARIFTTGVVPTVQVAPRPVRNAVIALLAGLVLGVSLALLLEYLDDRIRSKEQLDKLVPGVPVLGLIPVHSARATGGRLVSLAQPSSPAAEAYRSLKTALQFVGVERPPRVLQVTSPNAEDGKSSVASNLAVVLARGGQKVVLVDGDLRRAVLHDVFGLSNAVGFTSVFLGQVELAGALQPVPDVENLTVLTSGPTPPNPSELLSTKQTAEIFSALQDSHELVVVDCTPVLPVADAVAVSAWTDATVLVAAANSTSRRDLRRALELLRHADAPIIGTVLNRVTSESNYSYYYDDARRRRRSRAPSVAPSAPTSRPAGSGNGAHAPAENVSRRP
jgi:polysaccharide biosynthesis transport protein